MPQYIHSFIPKISIKYLLCADTVLGTEKMVQTGSLHVLIAGRAHRDNSLRAGTGDGEQNLEGSCPSS